jgi:hypothetical protein
VAYADSFGMGHNPVRPGFTVRLAGSNAPIDRPRRTVSAYGLPPPSSARSQSTNQPITTNSGYSSVSSRESPSTYELRYSCERGYFVIRHFPPVQTGFWFFPTHLPSNNCRPKATLQVVSHCDPERTPQDTILSEVRDIFLFQVSTQILMGCYSKYRYVPTTCHRCI